MKIYSRLNVFEEALQRIEYLFHEFDEVVVSHSGGKDSTVVFNLALMVAKKLDRLPLRVVFIDQEAEWELVIEHMRRVMAREEVVPMWFQMPMQISNGASHFKLWLQCWEPGGDWVREKEPNSIHENPYGTKTFAELFTKIIEKEFPNKSACYVAGVRAEESPTRYTALTSGATYKHITYGKILNRKLGHYTFYPIYDWGYRDIWKAIHENNWDYCEVYDRMYQYGEHPKAMRVSNLHHETALRNVHTIHEIDGKTWEKVSKRVEGLNTIKHLNKDAIENVRELPWMFSSWVEYRDYLLENLIQADIAKEKFTKKFAQMDERYAPAPEDIKGQMLRTHVSALLVNDYHMTKISNFERRPDVHSWRVAYKKQLEEEAGGN